MEELSVSRTTFEKYEMFIRRVFDCWDDEGRVPVDNWQLDVSLCDYAQGLLANGDVLSQGEYTLAGIHALAPHLATVLNIVSH